MRRILESPEGPDFPDVTVWLALVDGDHPFHARAKLYWENEAKASIAWCRVTMLGLVRLSTHDRVMAGNPLTAQQAWGAYEQLLASDGVFMDAEPAGIESTFKALSTRQEFNHRLWTDYYLAAWAIKRGGRLVSFDKDFARIPTLEMLLLEV